MITMMLITTNLTATKPEATLKIGMSFNEY